jgi:alkylation response protein AidB-like acyl-CoA dehydrogenase
MMAYQPPLREMQFVINEWLKAPLDWSVIPAFREIDVALSTSILKEAGRFAVDMLVPLNASGDQQGCRLEGGQVSTPQGFAYAYRAYVDNGWPALACDPAWGGQGLPQLLDAALQEMLVSANPAWAMYPGIVQGAYECLRTHASCEIQETYLHKLVSGEWLATMCITEPQAGSDVGLIRTHATWVERDCYRLDGNKLFISGGEQDLTDNIVHLLLARLPEAPAGSKGLSLFLVPKVLDGKPNGVYCEGLEHKMGIKGSATCALRFEHAQGWLIGEPHQGLAAMFVMMNSARLHVGLQGVGHVESAYQQALAYALERRQMRRLNRPAGCAEAADLIAHQPAIQRVLLELRACSEGMRTFGYWVAHLLDLASHGVGDQQRSCAHQVASLLTPVIKAFFTEQGFHQASAALQVFGGYGYVSDFGIEQTLRDSRIAMIYEGTNEIQANDLLLRKVLADKGEALTKLLDHYREEAVHCQAIEGCGRFGSALQKACERVEAITAELLKTDDPAWPYRAALDYLRIHGWLGLAFIWARSARLSVSRQDDVFYRDKYQTAGFFYDVLLLKVAHGLANIEASRVPLPALSSLPI